MKHSLTIPESILSSKQLIETVIDLASGYYAQNDTAHDFDHALRVTRLALHLGEMEKADLVLLALAGILHDTARREQELTGVCHAKRGGEIAGEILTELGFDKERTKLVQDMIITHRFRDNQEPQTIEGRILFDADKLDAIGAVGIARSYAICGRRNQKLFAPLGADLVSEDSGHYSPVMEYNFKLKKILDRLLTKSGRLMAERRHQLMQQFFAEMEAEVRGDI